MRGTVFGFHGKSHKSQRHPPKAFSNWYGLSRDEFLRAGTAPEDRVVFPTKARLPVKPRQVVLHPETASERAKNSAKTSSQPSLDTKEARGKNRAGEIEDDLAEEVIMEPRPPCRQNENTFELEDQMFIPRNNGFVNAKEQAERRPIRPMHEDLRPPSRHKTPPKAVGLDLPPRHGGGDLQCIDIESMYKDDDLSDYSDDAFASTLPLNREKQPRKHSSFCIDEEAKANFIKHRTQSTAYATCERKPAGKVGQQKRGIELPVIFNKRDKKTPAFGTPRRRTRSRGINEVVEKPRVSARNSKKRNIRAQSSHKSKTGQPLPFFSSLEPEFLDLFAKVDG